jgi:anthranilate phosphoribosyltransferase
VKARSGEVVLDPDLPTRGAEAPLDPVELGVPLNAGVALYAANVCDDMAQGIALARRAIESGAAARKLAELTAFSQLNTASVGP